MLILCAMATTTFARIGDTLEQCQKRYGKPVNSSEETKTHNFNSNQMKISVRFEDSKAVEVTYTPLGDGAISFDQISALLLANRGQSDWNTPGWNPKTDGMIWTDEGSTRGVTIDKARHELKFYLLDKEGKPLIKVDPKK